MHNQSVFLKHYFLIKVTDNSPESSLRQLLLLLCQKWDPARLCLWILENFVYGPWKMGIFESIRNYFKSFELYPIFHGHGSMRYFINQQQTNKALLVKNLFNACCDIGQSLPDLVDVHRQIHFFSAETQLPKKHVETRKLLEAKDCCGPEQVRWWWLTCPRPTGSG